MNNFKIKIEPAKQDVGLQILYGSCTDKEIKEYVSNEQAYVKVKCNNKQAFTSLPCIRLHLKNNADIQYKENGITIAKIVVSDNIFSYNVISPDSATIPYTIINGDKDGLKVNIICDRKKCLERIKSNKLINLSVGIDYLVNGGILQNEMFHFQIEFYEQVISHIYSLDYGTTGIVLSKYEGGSVIALELRDVDYDIDKENSSNEGDKPEPLEKETTIVSSISILTDPQKNRKASLILAPSRLDYNRGAVFILSPTKFLIGQPKIPFVDLYAKKFDEIENFSGHITEIKAEDIVKHSYKDVFERFDHDGVRKLILTYPNTYVPKQIKILRDILKQEFELLDDSNIHFVPESDSVVSYYVEMRRKSPKGFPMENERILIYDMGAGTLDISYVIISKKQSEYNIELKKRIGIPVAGNYLDWELYEIIKNEISDKKTSKKIIKNYVKNFLKVDLSMPQTSDAANDLQGAGDTIDTKGGNTTNEQQDEKNYLNSLYNITDLFKGDSKLSRDEIIAKLEKSYFLKVCGDLIFQVLFPENKEKWNEEIDTFVLSGRASQFSPLVNKIKEKFGKANMESLPQLKTCVSEGAIYYQRIKDDQKNKKFKFVSRSQYLKLGAIYAVDNEYGGLSYNYCELINPDKENWDDAEDINGTLYVQLKGEGIMDLQRDDDIIFIQTLLSEDDVRKNYINPMNEALKNNEHLDKLGEYDCFIHKLFKVSPEGILENREEIKTEVEINKDNQVFVICTDVEQNRYPLEVQYFVENVENNEYYKRAAWPSNENEL
jgi:molecular chaperone DnaK (HSP70)